ncbi:sugar ABC transporter substrate-binding protein [Thermatribacter velox]|uniref:Sugar ABC transporter substrate-binding protein n=1 Tax=Thermatribacter velox TaxID=3039681 RepID=A0ABZ2Y9D1_9BACT
MKKSLLVVLCLMGLLFVTTASSVAQEKIEITFWHHEAPAHRVAAFQKVIDLFVKENPDVEINQEVVMWGDAWVKTLSAMEAGTLPDFQFSIPDLLLTMYKAGAVAPVTDLVNEIDEKYQFFPNQRNIYAHDGEYWGVPIFTMVMLLTYRPSFFEEYLGTKEPPKTWDEALEYAKKITEASEEEVYGIGIGGAKNLMTDEQAYIFLASAGARFFDENGRVIFNNPKTIEALKLYKEFFQYAPPGAEAWSWGEIELNIAAGTIAMSPYFPSVQKRFHEEFDSNDYDAAHIPYFKDRKERGTITYPNEIHIYKDTLKNGEKHMNAIKNFIKFMMRPEINAILTAEQEPGGFFPTTVAASQAKEYWENPIVKRFENIHKVAFEALQEYATLYGFEYGKWVNLGIGDITGADVLAEVVNKVVSGQMSVEEAVAWGHQEMEKYSVPVSQ